MIPERRACWNCCCRPKVRLPQRVSQPINNRRPAEELHRHDHSSSTVHRGLRRDRQRLRIPRRQLAAAARRRWPRPARQYLSHRDRQYRYAGIEFAGDDGRRHRGQRRQNAGQGRPRRHRGLGQTRNRGAGKRGSRRRPDQLAGFDARGTQSPARSAGHRDASSPGPLFRWTVRRRIRRRSRRCRRCRSC